MKALLNLNNRNNNIRLFFIINLVSPRISAEGWSMFSTELTTTNESI